MIESMDAVKVISRHRGEALIIAEMTQGTELPIVTTRPELDLPFNWAAMGKGSSPDLTGRSSLWTATAHCSPTWVA